MGVFVVVPPPMLPWTARVERAREGCGAGRGEDVAQDVAESVLGAAEDGSLVVCFLFIAIFQRMNSRPTHVSRPPRRPWATRERMAREGRGAGRGGGCGGGRSTGRGAGPGLWGRAAHAPLTTPPPLREAPLRSSRLAEMVAQLGSSVTFDLNSGNISCARLGGKVALPFGVVKEEVAHLVVLVRRHCCPVGAAVRRDMDDEEKAGGGLAEHPAVLLAEVEVAERMGIRVDMPLKVIWVPLVLPPGVGSGPDGITEMAFMSELWFAVVPFPPLRVFLCCCRRRRRTFRAQRH